MSAELLGRGRLQFSFEASSQRDIVVLRVSYRKMKWMTTYAALNYRLKTRRPMWRGLSQLKCRQENLKSIYIYTDELSTSSETIDHTNTSENILSDISINICVYHRSPDSH